MRSAKWLVRGIGIGALAVLSACAQPEGTSQQQERATMQMTQELEDAYKTWGRGYNKLTDSAAGTCVDPGPVAPAGDWPGQTMYYALELIESSEKLHQKLEVSASADVKFGLGQSVDGKVTFAKNVDMSSTAVYVLASVQVENAPRSIPNAQLTQVAWDTLAVNPSRFREMCGDAFLAGMRNGAEYRAVIKIQTNSQEEKTHLVSQLNVKLPVVNGSASFEHALTTVLAGRQISTWGYQRGGQGSSQLPVCMTPECIIASRRKSPISP